MKVIVGLGNPGNQYTYTRHNVGFLCVDYLIGQYVSSPQWKYVSKFLAYVTECNIGHEKILFCKPDTYMNKSGTSLQNICHFYKLSAQDIFVIYDDKDMDFGKIRIRHCGTSGGHNGVKDIIRFLGEDWLRMKIGVGKPPEKHDTADWVLSKFTAEERIQLTASVFGEIHTRLLSYLSCS